MYLKDIEQSVLRVEKVATDPDIRATDIFKPVQSGE